MPRTKPLQEMNFKQQKVFLPDKNFMASVTTVVKKTFPMEVASSLQTFFTNKYNFVLYEEGLYKPTISPQTKYCFDNITQTLCE